jgi:hypothetical protein
MVERRSPRPNDLPRYKALYMDVIAAILRSAQYANLCS